QWHALDKSEQQKYYDMAKREKELHLQMYPGWSARDNYATHTKKKKRKKEAGVNNSCPHNLNCKSHFGLDQHHNWCSDCRLVMCCSHTFNI
ncbi:hypothetical protein HELRODRAFT_68905, partial [Helobdella robusta]|uniref:HMG box domain-containing protein n=1 Tax=Helobdella robusta TaxID=6412 RepID=T1FZK9_HELRO